MDLRIFNIDSRCTGCGACVSICPKSCLSLMPNKEGFYYPQTTNEACIECGLCEKACHVLNPVNNNHVEESGFVMYQSERENVVEASSSGGIFTLLAEYTIQKGGVVFGTWFNPDTERLEIASSDEVDWHLFRKSKYIETFTGDTFMKVSQLLKEGKDVLFCSTPCQVRGLIQFLDRKRIAKEHLITIDLICHGVPSMKHFLFFYRRHVNKDKRIKDLNFRHKDFTSKKYLWHNPAIVFNYEDGTQDIFSGNTPSSFQYIRCFNDDISLRKSCYGCRYPEFSFADYTIADFWGIGDYKPHLDDNRGISLVKMNTDRAASIFRTIEKNGTAEEIDPKYGKYIYQKQDKTPLRPTRDIFYKYVERYGYFFAVFLTYRSKLAIAYLKYWIKMLIGRNVE